MAIVQLKKGTLSPIGLLMVVSELLIAIFVFRWLQSEYRGEKAELQKNLFDQFDAARSRVMDTLISKNLIDPILNDPQGFKIHELHSGQLRHGPDSIKIIAMNSEFDVVTTDSMKISNGKDSCAPQNAKVQVRVMSDSTDKLLYHGVKMFISKVRGPNGENDFFEKHVLPGDTMMLKKFFAQNLSKNHYTVKSVWMNDLPEKERMPPLFYYETAFFDHPYGVQIEQYNGFLLKQILPQILFAMLLLLITSAAFIFSYRSLRNQLRLSALKDDFISNMSHELKTPVATMKVAVEAMQQMDPAEKKETMKEYLGMASQELTRLDLLITKVMNGILMDNEKQPLHTETVNLKSLIEQSLKSMELQFHQRNARVNFTSDAEEINANVDSLLIQGIFFNLIDNSLKYGKGEPEIGIHLSETSSDVIVDFSDNGPGIAEEYIDKVFDKFLRVPTGNHHTVKGYGLGLNYVAQVMKMHRGSVLVKNLPQGGCEFTLKFPKA